MNFSQYTNKNSEEVFEMLKSQESGLSEKEAVSRQKVYGFNEIKTKEIRPLHILIRQFRSPFFYLLFIAAIICFTIGEIINGLVILGFVFINASLGFLQEGRAEKTAALLKSFIPAKKPCFVVFNSSCIFLKNTD